MEFKSETISKEWFAEALPLLKLNYEETGHLKSCGLDIDQETYLKLQDNNLLKVFTAKDGDDLIGIAVFLVTNHLHTQTLESKNDTFFIHPKYRGYGYSFMRYCERELALIGVECIYFYVKPYHDWSPLLKRTHYQLEETTYKKQLEVHSGS